jgi:hypothetical protein
MKKGNGKSVSEHITNVLNQSAEASIFQCSIEAKKQLEKEDELKREGLTKQLMWNSGGFGYGICEVAGMMIQEMMVPTKENPDWISVVAISGPPTKYTTEELKKLVEFSKKETARYDKLFRWRMGCNLIFINKEDNYKGGHIWFRKRQTWQYGPYWSDTLDEAITVMSR